jgi:hypothetical protein
LHGRFYEQASRGNIYTAHAIVTAVIYTTAAGTGGPLLWNGSTTALASILAVGWGISTVTTVAAVSASPAVHNKDRHRARRLLSTA